MLLRAPIRRHQAVALALAGVMAMSPAALAQTTTSQKPAGQATPAPAKPAATPAPPPAAPKPAGVKPAGSAKPATEAPVAAAPGTGTSDRFTATAVNLAGVSGETITVDLIRWSTDAERDKVVSTLKDKGDKDLLPVLQGAPNIGYIWRSGTGVGSVVRYAYQWKGADGEHVVLATDSDLHSWQSPSAAAAKPAANAAPAVQYPFTVIEIVVPAAGPSAGKMSLASKVISDPDAKTIRLEDDTGAPVTLKGVRHMKGAAR
jgi:hypothetical protein